MKAAGKNMAENAAAPKMKGFLGTIERIGNALPHPFILFLYITGALMVLSAVLAGMGVQVQSDHRQNCRCPQHHQPGRSGLAAPEYVEELF